MSSIVYGLIAVALCEGIAIWILDKRREARLRAGADFSPEDQSD